MSSLSGVNINFDGDATVNEADVYRGVFNYEIGDKTRTDQGLDANFKPAAVITNSRVYFLSSEFLDRNTVFPFSYQYPANPYSVKNDYFLETYCDPVWPTSCGGVSGFPAEPDPVTWSWVRTNLTDQQQGCLLAAGESRYQSVHAADMVNTVGFGQLLIWLWPALLSPGDTAWSAGEAVLLRYFWRGRFLRSVFGVMRTLVIKYPLPYPA